MQDLTVNGRYQKRLNEWDTRKVWSALHLILLLVLPFHVYSRKEKLILAPLPKLALIIPSTYCLDRWSKMETFYTNFSVKHFNGGMTEQKYQSSTVTESMKVVAMAWRRRNLCLCCLSAAAHVALFLSFCIHTVYIHIHDEYVCPSTRRGSFYIHTCIICAYIHEWIRTYVRLLHVFLSFFLHTYIHTWIRTCAPLLSFYSLFLCIYYSGPPQSCFSFFF